MKKELYNVEQTEYTEEQIRPLAELAAELGVLIHINGMPFGNYNKARSRPVDDE